MHLVDSELFGLARLSDAPGGGPAALACSLARTQLIRNPAVCAQVHMSACICACSDVHNAHLCTCVSMHAHEQHMFAHVCVPDFQLYCWSSPS